MKIIDIILFQEQNASRSAQEKTFEKSILNFTLNFLKVSPNGTLGS